VKGKSVLIVCYSYPPYPGVGGRRWAKFSRLLAERGYDVYVVCSENPHSKKSEWLSDARNIHVTTLPLKYPKALILYPGGLSGRIRYRLSLLYVKLFTKRNYYDRTVFWKKQLSKTVRTFINEKNISNIIVSGAPFSLFSHVGMLRREFPHLNLIADLRDPWTNNEMAYAFNTLSPRRLAYEKQCEQTVFNDFDWVTTVNDQMTSYFKKLYPSSKEKFLTVENGFDPAEILQKEDVSLRMSDEKTNLVFTGSFYEKALYLFDNLLAALNKAEKQADLGKFHFYFFGPNVSILRQRVEKAGLSALFSFGNYHEIESVNWLISRADLCMLFLTDDINYSFSTKFCEYIKFRKKILVFSKAGLTGKFVTEHKIGLHVDAGLEEELITKLSSGELKHAPFSTDFDTSVFSIESLVDKYTKLIK
jgi:hypothetical protein